jgi:hypothetical protein
MTLFSLDKDEVTFYKKKFTLIDRSLLFFLPCGVILEELIIVVSILELKFRISNYLSRGKGN